MSPFAPYSAACVKARQRQEMQVSLAKMQGTSSPPSRPLGPAGRSAAAPSALHWDDARVLLALLQARTLSGAGRRLGVNASTVSRRLEALETALGARLFDRTPDGARPTALAEQLGPHAEAMERAAAGLALTAQGRETVAEGDVRLTAPPGVAEFVVAPALPRLLKRHPRLRVVLDASVGYADLTRREADIALRLARPTAGDLVARRVGVADGGLYGAPRYVRELGVLQTLGAARWITWGEDLAHLPPARFVADLVPAERVVLRTSHMGSMVAAAAAGLGLLVLDQPMGVACGLAPVTLDARLRRSLPSMEAASEAWLVAHRALRDVPRIAAVWDFLGEELTRLGLHAGAVASAAVQPRGDGTSPPAPSPPVRR